MLIVVLGFVLLFACRTTAAPAISEADAAQLFEKAGQLYADGEHASAAELYSRLINSGYRYHAVLYNHGNASLLAGDLGAAVLSYRRAARVSPRDADSAANLSTALRKAGVKPPVALGPADVLRNASLVEWVVLCQIFYWLSAIVAALAFVVRSHRRQFMMAVILLWLLTAISLAGVAAWTGPSVKDEAVAIQAGHVRLAPSESAISYSPLPAGSIVRALEVSGKWVKISTGNRAGWIPQASIVIVCDYVGR
jgi:tetratricopeptide (TPR) repeat protein